MDRRINFYEEVEILPCTIHKEYIGKRGGVMGISEENGVIYSYAIKLYDHEYLISFDKDDLYPTGNQLKQEDFY